MIGLPYRICNVRTCTVELELALLSLGSFNVHNLEGGNDSVALLDCLDLRSNLINNSHVLMA